MNKPPSLRQQADAVELAAANHRGHVRNLTDLVAKGRRPKHELDLARMYLPGLEQAAITLRFIEQNQDLNNVLTKAGYG